MVFQHITLFCQQTSRLSFITEINSIGYTPSHSDSADSAFFTSFGFLITLLDHLLLLYQPECLPHLKQQPQWYMVRSFFPLIMKQSISNAPLDTVLETSGRTLSTPCCGCCPRHRVAQRTPPNAATAGMRMEWRRITHPSEPRLCTARSRGRPAVLAPHQPVDLLQPALLPPDGRQIAVCWACATHGLLQP